MDNTNTNKDVVETPADEKPAESITATSAANPAPISEPQSAKPEAEAPAFVKEDDACSASAKEGDTLLTIANRHKVSLGLLKAINGIDDALKKLDKGKLIKFK